MINEEDVCGNSSYAAEALWTQKSQIIIICIINNKVFIKEPEKIWTGF